MFPVPPPAAALALLGLMEIAPRVKRRAEEFARALELKLERVAIVPESSSMPTVALRPPPKPG